MLRSKATSGQLAGISDFWWSRAPCAAARFSSAVTAVLADGMYLATWPVVGAFVVPLVFFIGFLLGTVHFYSELYTYSLVVMGLLLIISQFGAGVGLATWLGYIVGDFVLYSIPNALSFGPNPLQLFILLPATHIISYLLLAILIIIIPLTTRGLTRLTLWRLRFYANLAIKALRPNKPAPGRFLREAQIFLDIPLQAFLAILLVYLWTQAAATLIRPFYTFYGQTPPTEAIQPLQQFGWVLAILAALIGTARVVFEFVASSQSSYKLRSLRLRLAVQSRGRPRLIIALLAAPVQAFVLSFLMAGIIGSWLEAILLFIVVAGLFVVRATAAEFLGFWARIVSYIPIVIRFVLCLLISYLVGLPLMNILWDQTNTFLPILIGTVISLIFFTILLPSGETSVPSSSTGARGKT